MAAVWYKNNFYNSLTYALDKNMLTCDKLALSRGGHVLQKDIGFTVKSGGALVVMGPNGSGKTTLLRTLAGLRKPDAGTIEWLEIPIGYDPVAFRSHMHFVGHTNAVKRELTVIVNLRFFAGLFGTDSIVEAAMHFYKLTEYADMPCGTLSAGWQRRVAMARLMISDTNLWILDEPFSHLDATATTMVENMIITKCSQGGVVVMSSHIKPNIGFATTYELKAGAA